MTRDVENFGLILHDAFRLMRRRFDALAADMGLSSAQWRLLVFLMREHGRATQARLAELLEIEPISVSRLLERMQEAGWILRETDPHDRRLRIVRPTDKTLKIFEKVRGCSASVNDRALQGLNEDARKQLVAALHVVVGNLSQTHSDEVGHDD